MSPGETMAHARARNKSAAVRIVRRANPGEGGTEKSAVTRWTVRSDVANGALFSSERARRGSRGVAPVAISAAHIDDDGSLPGKVLLKTLFDGVKCVAGCIRIAVRRDPHKEVHFTDADQLANQIVRKYRIFGQGACSLAFNLQYLESFSDALASAARSNPAKLKPIKLVRPQREQVRRFSKPGKQVSPKHLDRYVALKASHIQFHSLRGT